MSHLTYEQRYSIELLLKSKKKQIEIANIIGCDKSTISRELKRNTIKGIYEAKYAHKQSQKRHRRDHKPYKLTVAIWRFIKTCIRNKDSPVQASEHVKKKFQISISHEWIYKKIYEHDKYGRDLTEHLRHRRRHRLKRSNRTSQRGKIPNRVMIDQRPEIINTKEEFGHWEADTIIGKNHKGAILTMVERQSKFTLIASLPDKTKESVHNAILKWKDLYSNHIKSITVDNGMEFANHELTQKKTNIHFYFAQPYSPWQRGLNENTNGLIRQFIPKSTDFQTITKSKIYEIQENLNNRIRKTLNFESPNQFFNRVAFES